MGAYLVGLWLYTIFTMLPFGIWAIYMMKKEGWIFNKKERSGGLTFFIVGGFVYQVVLPFYWVFVLAPNGIPMSA
jgi:murein tripeptide amidase MpaA